jgi:hypothetical protein
MQIASSKIVSLEGQTPALQFRSSDLWCRYREFEVKYFGNGSRENPKPTVIGSMSDVRAPGMPIEFAPHSWSNVAADFLLAIRNAMPVGVQPLA